MDNRDGLLKKLKALAESGVGGEKENAQAMLEKYMRKYGITETDLERDEELKVREFEYHSHKEKRLLMQIIFKVTNSTSMYSFYRSKRKVRNLVGCECSKAQGIEIEFLFDFYKRLYQKEEERLLDAFIQKHKLFGDSPEEDRERRSDREILEMITLMNALSDERPQLQIERKRY